MNLLDTAMEGCQRSAAAERWISLGISWADGEMEVLCRNSACEDAADKGTSKADKRAHGFGLPIIREIAKRYGGAATAGREEGCFSVEVRMEASREAHACP